MQNSNTTEKNDASAITNNNVIPQTQHYMAWSIENEEILIKWCDYAQCYKWLNYQAQQHYSYLHAWFTISTILLSTTSGVISFSHPILGITYIPYIVGSINIFVGMISAIQQYLNISELKEAYRVCEVAWGKLSRNILIEIAKSPNERMDATNFFKITRNEYDRLTEINPTIPEHIIKEFKDNFVGDENSDQRKKYAELRKPDICDDIISASYSRHKWYKINDISYNIDSVTYNNTLDISSVSLQNISFDISNSFKYISKEDIEHNIV